jgi:hypothetical protein
MPDDGDISQARQEIEERILTAALRERSHQEVPITGKCHYCQEPIEHPKRWCDQNCLHDWQKYIK